MLLGVARELEHVEYRYAQEFRFGITMREPAQVRRNVFQHEKIFIQLADEHLLGRAVLARLRGVADELRALAALGGVDFDCLRLRAKGGTRNADCNKERSHRRSLRLKPL